MTPDQHDTPEAVEMHASQIELCSMHRTAAMLRRLHARAVDAEREREKASKCFRDSLTFATSLFDERDETRAALATARADALREAIGIANERGAWASNDLDADSLKDRLEANGRMDMAKEIAGAIRAAGGGA